MSGIRVGPWKMLFSTKPNGKYNEDMVKHTMPKLFNLRKDPFEVYDGQVGFEQIMKKSWLIQPAIGIIQEHLQSFKDFPPRQASASLNLSEAIESALKAAGN